MPVLTITSQAFVSLRDYEARNFGLPSLPFVTVPHPYGQLPPEEALRLASLAAEEVLQAIAQRAEVPLPA